MTNCNAPIEQLVIKAEIKNIVLNLGRFNLKTVLCNEEGLFLKIDFIYFIFSVSKSHDKFDRQIILSIQINQIES